MVTAQKALDQRLDRLLADRAFLQIAEAALSVADNPDVSPLIRLKAHLVCKVALDAAALRHNMVTG